MSNLLWAPIAVAAGRELAMSGLPDAPVVADKRRRASRPVHRGSGRLPAVPRRPFARSPSTARRSDLAVALRLAVWIRVVGDVRGCGEGPDRRRADSL